MNTNILIHKNSYSKIHSCVTYACSSLFTDVKMISLHNQIYDVALSLQPKTIILQIEEYTQEIHTFLHDKSLPNYNIIITMDNVPSRYNKFISLIEDINRNVSISFKLLIPAYVYAVLLEKGINTNALIGYDKVYNNYVFNNQKNTNRNNKILCILDDNTECIDMIKPYLYPNTKSPIIMVNNPQIEYDQNIGLLFDSDMNKALNTYGSVIDMSRSYDAEIAVCGIPAYSIDQLDSFLESEPKTLSIETTPAELFIKQITEYIL